MNLIDIFRRKQDFPQKISDSRGRLYRTAYAWCHDRDIADDIVQQTLCNALQNYQQVRELAALNGWLFKILARCFADYYRVNKESVSDDTSQLVDDHTPERAASEQEVVQRVRDALKRIPFDQRQVVTLIDLERFSYLDVANIMSIPVGTVMSRLSRGRQALHKRLIATKTSQDSLVSGRIRRLK